MKQSVHANIGHRAMKNPPRHAEAIAVGSNSNHKVCHLSRRVATISQLNRISPRHKFINANSDASASRVVVM